MLGTLAMFITGLAVFGFRRRRETGTHLRVNGRRQQRDLSFFLLIYLGAAGASFIPNAGAKLLCAPLFVLFYVLYAWRVFKADTGTSNVDLAPLTLDVSSARVRNVSTRESPLAVACHYSNPPLACLHYCGGSALCQSNRKPRRTAQR